MRWQFSRKVVLAPFLCSVDQVPRALASIRAKIAAYDRKIDELHEKIAAKVDESDCTMTDDSSSDVGSSGPRRER